MSNKSNIINFSEKIKKTDSTFSEPSSKTKASATSKEAENKEVKNIVNFPGSKTTSIKKALDADQKFKAVLGGRVISTLLGMIVLTVGVQSLWLSTNDSKKEGRGLASSIGRSLASMEAYLSGSKRGVASVAKQPSQLEGFIFGSLRGRYTVETEGLFIKAISSNGKFIQIASAARFVKKHKGLWAVQFTTLKLARFNKKGKVYILFKGEEAVGRAIVSVDRQGNLQSLEFKKNL
ncbi:MAG: hypothetical protein HAW63_01485 [Bdellovibrionaceae bacterium]|nr:hypothetical protein [Pseudobdellovibrionaceae bacterium]